MYKCGCGPQVGHPCTKVLLFTRHTYSTFAHAYRSTGLCHATSYIQGGNRRVLQQGHVNWAGDPGADGAADVCQIESDSTKSVSHRLLYILPQPVWASLRAAGNNVYEPPLIDLLVRLPRGSLFYE